MMRPSLVFSYTGGCTLCQVLDLSSFGTAGNIIRYQAMWTLWSRITHQTLNMLTLHQCSKLNFSTQTPGQSCWPRNKVHDMTNRHNFSWFYSILILCLWADIVLAQNVQYQKIFISISWKVIGNSARVGGLKSQICKLKLNFWGGG